MVRMGRRATSDGRKALGDAWGRRARRVLAAIATVIVLGAAVGTGPSAEAQGGGPVLHEMIPANPREDVAMGVALSGDIPAAIDTPRGLVAAPDPDRPIGSGESPYRPPADSAAPDDTFRPDRDTRRPDVLPYDDPFSPSTAPFKRLSAFDTVDANYNLLVRDAHQAPMNVSASPAPTGVEEQFFADMVVDLSPSVKVRIPSVGPGARVLRARAGVGAEDVPIRLYRDGADNWFVEGDTAMQVRLVMELSILRATFGGDFGNPSWGDLPPIGALPNRVTIAAPEVFAKLGLSRRLSPRDNVNKLVAYFRSFKDSDEPPSVSRDIYLDLALSQKGVCRHRAFAFMVTALALGLPTRVVVNEAHAWVEVHNGRMWRRIDLGGAGRTLHDPLSDNVPHDPPPDPFSWPQGSTPGNDLAERSRPNGGGSAPGGGGPRSTPSASPSGRVPHGGAPGQRDADHQGDDPTDPNGPLGQTQRVPDPGATGTAATPDDRPISVVTMTLAEGDARRGAPLRMRGQVASGGEPCGHVTVEVYLHAAEGDVAIGQLATDERGFYDGSLVLPSGLPLGDYDVRASTLGDVRCGRGRTR